MTNLIQTKDGFLSPNSTMIFSRIDTISNRNSMTIFSNTTSISLQELSTWDPALQLVIPEGQEGRLSITDENQNEIQSYTAALDITVSALLKEVTETMSQRNNQLPNAPRICSAAS
jgi:gamma-glutamylcysteine synthetase